MDVIEVVIWVIGIVIYVIAAATGRTGNPRLGRYGILGVEDFSLEYDPLENIRNHYEERLKIYYLHNQPKQYNINKNCEARLVQTRRGKMYFYCKERTNGKSAGRYFEVKGDSGHVATMWAIIDMEFNKHSRFQDIKDLYYSLNHGFETRGGLRYYSEPLFNRLPEPELNQSAQNEYCRMSIQTLADGEKVLYCTEIWGINKYDKPRMFVIRGNKPVLYGILSEFAKEKDKMQDYLKLLYKYTMYHGVTVKEAEIEESEEKQQVKVKLDQPKYDESNPEPIKYIHVDFSGVNDKGRNHKEIQRKDTKHEKEQDINEEKSTQKIEKYDERNLDL